LTNNLVVEIEINMVVDVACDGEGLKEVDDGGGGRIVDYYYYYKSIDYLVVSN
jgi:hypothetical protein